MGGLDAVVLDIGNVLLRFQPEQIIDRLTPCHDERRALLHRAVFQSPCWALLDRGAITPEEAARHMAMAARRPDIEADARTLIDKFIYALDRLPLSYALDDVKARGVRLYALTNYPLKAFEDTLERFSFFDRFDGMVVSARERLCKPEPGIYRALLSRYGLAPDRVLFADDSWDNVVGAMALGMRGFWFEEGTTNEVFLAAL